MKLRKILPASVVLFAGAACQKPVEKPNYSIQGIPFNEMKIDDGFWHPKTKLTALSQSQPRLQNAKKWGE